MTTIEIIEILERIDNLLFFDKKFEARDYIKLEISNLKNEIPEECRNIKNFKKFCAGCSNTHCINKK